MNVPDRLTCEEVFARLDDYVDRELSAEEARLVEEHCAVCDVCAREYRFEAGSAGGGAGEAAPDRGAGRSHAAHRRRASATCRADASARTSHSR